MNINAKLRSRIENLPRQNLIQGTWRTIKVCLDQDAGEFLNMGVAFQHEGKLDVRMLDSFQRVACLYDGRIEQNDLMHYLLDIEAMLHSFGGELPADLGPDIQLGEPLYASGHSAEQIVDEFFADVVTLARPKGAHKRDHFRYQSSPKLRDSVLRIMTEKMRLEASRIVQAEKFRLKMNTGHYLDVDVPLLSSNAVGQIASAWYKSPAVVEINILQAASDLHLITSNTGRKGSLSVLLPSDESGMNLIEFNKVNDIASRHLERLSKSGIEIISASSTDVLANKTIDWWRPAA